MRSPVVTALAVIAVGVMVFLPSCAIESDAGNKKDAGQDADGDTQTDQDTGGDDTVCESECSQEGQRECDGNGYRLCGDQNDDGCLEWSDTIACSDDEFCEEGQCTTECRDLCAAGALRCVDGDSTSFEACGDFDDDPCKEWSDPQSCQAGRVCEAGRCVCDTPCSYGSRICVDQTAYETCMDHDGDGCEEFGDRVACREGLLCDEGQCVVDCTDACDTGESRCSDGLSQMCGDFDEDPCQEWSQATPCPSGHACAGDACACTQECVLGQRRCASTGGEASELCGDDNSDGCPEWGEPTPCGELEFCDPGVGHCVPICTDACDTQGETRCLGGGIDAFEGCADHDEDPCLEWGGQTFCQAGWECPAGQPECVCANVCEPGQQRCVPGAEAYETCDDHNGDLCPVWGGQVDCPADQVCHQPTGNCISPYPDGPYGTNQGDTIANECLEEALCNGSVPVGGEPFCFDRLLGRKASVISIHRGG
jgi:hypothetical protein